MSDRRLGVCLTALVVAAALTGCGGGGTAGKAKAGSGDTAAGGASGNAITIANFKFDPTPLKAKSGTKITVTNTDSAVHTITASDKSFNSKELKKGQTYSFTAGKPGKYTYICDIHQYMKGTLEVS